MALVTNFTDRIEDISGACSDDNAVETFITDGCYDVINRVKAISPQKIDLFTTDTSLTAPSVSITTERDITSVYRKNFSVGYGVNLLATNNQGFETAITNAASITDTDSGDWIHRGMTTDAVGTIARTTLTDSNKTGTYGGLLTANGLVNRVYLIHTTVRTTSYKFSLYVRIPGSSAIVSLALAAHTEALASESFAVGAAVTPNSGGWVAAEIEFTAQSTTTYLAITFGGSVATTGWIDDLSLEEKQDVSNYYPCRYVSSDEGNYKIKNQDSIYYSNNYTDPVFYFHGGSLYVLPEPDANNSASYKKIPEYVITNPASGASEIASFPTQYYEHVLTYAGIMNLQRQLRNLTDSLPTVPTFAGPSNFVMPSSLANSDIDFSGVPAYPIYVAPNVPALSEKNQGSVVFGTSAPTYTAPVVTGATSLLAMDAVSTEDTPAGVDAEFDDFGKWFQVAAEFIEDEEDTELAQAQLGKIQAYTQAYQASQQDSLNEFNEANAKYQAELQVAIKNADLNSDVDAKKLAKYSSDIQHQTQIFTAQLNTYQQEIQKALQKYQAETGYDVSKFSAEVQSEGTRITSQLQIDTQDYRSGVENFKSNLEKFNVDYGWKQSQQKFLINRYEAMFVSEGIQAKPQEG